ncbi:hypothetical protein Scep_018314 [Stephania cephalantha]|uniref:Uncharacterized protein n=1 Tax=Stephania cephalantha TaxID=152367 RepID=A0AAP0NXT6_9MAGN
MIESFFSATRRIDPQPQPISTSDSIILLSGPRSCGKTSLLFQFALNSVLEMSSSSNGYVVFICSRSRLENNPPYLSQGVDPSSDVFERIHMKYVDDDEGMKKYFAAFHLHEMSPKAVIVDDFGDFFDDSKCQEIYNSPRGRDLAMVRTLALCRDAIMHANEKLDSGNSCKLLISDTYQGDTPRSLFIYKRWASSIFTIKGNGQESYLLSSGSSSLEDMNGLSRVSRYLGSLYILILSSIKKDNLILTIWYKEACPQVSTVANIDRSSALPFGAQLLINSNIFFSCVGF